MPTRIALRTKNEDHPNVNDTSKEGSLVNTNEDPPDVKNKTEIDKHLNKKQKDMI